MRGREPDSSRKSVRYFGPIPDIKRTKNGAETGAMKSFVGQTQVLKIGRAQNKRRKLNDRVLKVKRRGQLPRTRKFDAAVRTARSRDFVCLSLPRNRRCPTRNLMLVQPSPAPNQVQQFLNGITARLAQLAKDPPDLSAYLRVHAECISAVLKPVGFAYEMQTGTNLQRVLVANLESLRYRDFPEQENAFQRAQRMAFEQKKPVVIPPQTQGTVGKQGISIEDAPAPDELPLFNRTAFEQVFVPIPNGTSSAGVLHIWFQPAEAPAHTHTRVSLLKQLCNEIENYLKARRARDASHEVARLSTYARLLEELTGDIDLESVSWNLVNFAREAVACERVCLFSARNYDRISGGEALVGELEYEFELQACSGLKRPHPRSEQATTLQRVAQRLTQMSLSRASSNAGANGDGGQKALMETAGAKQDGNGDAPTTSDPKTEKALATVRSGTTANRPQAQITLMMRDPSKTATRPAEINEYFDLMPMNWATVIPLFDRNHRVCGILFFEGVKAEEKLSNSLKPMLELAASAGRALGTALYCSQHRSMRMARRVVQMREQYVNTPTRRKWLRFGLPVLLLVGFLLFPLEYNIKGNATVLPVTQQTLPTLVNARLLEVLVREGESVKQGQVLARFDTREIQLQLAQLQQEYERALVESDSALTLGNEAQMQIGRLNANKAAAMAQKLQLDLENATVRAPFDGLVLGAQTLSRRIGEVLRLGEPALQVADPRAWQVKANLREKDLIFLDERLKDTGPVPATLRLAANPAHQYTVRLTSSDELAYGLDTSHGEYEFTAMLPLTESIEDPTLFKSGFTGRISFDAGKHPMAYILFRDFVHFITVRFF